jgi:ATP-dependent Lhr-like helicase
VAGALVVLVDGEACAWLDRRGHSLLTFPAAAGDDAWLGALVDLLKDGRVRSLEVRKIDGEPAGASPWARPLRAIGFADGYRGLVLRG